MRRVMAERCTPASTATREPLRQSWEMERTRKAVVFDSWGPPPEPYDGCKQGNVVGLKSIRGR